MNCYSAINGSTRLAIAGLVSLLLLCSYPKIASAATLSQEQLHNLALTIIIAKQRKLDPALLAALVWTESSARAFARSSIDDGTKSAVGLGQITLPALVDRGYSATDMELMTIPIANLVAVSSYLNYLLYRYKQYGNFAYIYALMAFNAGPTRVNTWIDGHLNMTALDEENFRKIPFSETRNHLKRTLSYWAAISTCQAISTRQCLIRVFGD